MATSMFNRTNPVDRIAIIRTALEAAGITFQRNGDLAGVKLRRPEE